MGSQASQLPIDSTASATAPRSAGAGALVTRGLRSPRSVGPSFRFSERSPSSTSRAYRTTVCRSPSARDLHGTRGFGHPGTIGQSAGILALLIFVFLWLYPLRKKYRALAFTGSVARWLDVHILAAIGLPLLLAIHASWRFEGIVGLGYFAMLIVCASGVVGRYLYVRIPRSRSGVASTREEVATERRT